MSVVTSLFMVYIMCFSQATVRLLQNISYNLQDARQSAVILFYKGFKITHLQFKLEVFSLSFSSV